MENQTPKHFVLQLGSLISLYISLGFLISLLYGIINLKFPDATEGYHMLESASSAVRLGIAMVVVFFPTYIVLTRLVNSLRRKESNASYLTLTKWLVYGSLLVGIGILLIDLSVVIVTFLEGEITTRFAMKAFSVLAVIGLSIHYYIMDAQGFWLKNESKSIMYGTGVVLAVFAIVSFGLKYIDTPAQVREMKLDEKQITDLQNIQWRIEDYLATSSSTPATLEEIFTNANIPTAPEDRDTYTYTVTNNGFKLCATFARDSNNTNDIAYPVGVKSETRIIGSDNWSYTAGETCFDRTVR